MARCPRCRHHVPRGDVFCFNCGYEMKTKDTRYDNMILACVGALVVLGLFMGWWTMRGGYLYRAKAFANALMDYCHGSEKEQEKALQELDGYSLEHKNYHWEVYDSLPNTQSLKEGNHSEYGKVRDPSEMELAVFRRYLQENNTDFQEIHGLKAMDVDIEIVSKVDVIRMENASFLIYKCREKWRVMLFKEEG